MDPELNEIGRQQAVVVARRLSKEAKPAATYSSDLKCAAETAETIAKLCDVSNVVLNEALRERHMGYLQGLKWDDVVNKNPDVFRGFDIFKITEGSDPDSRNQEVPGGGESLNQLTERCVSHLSKIAQEHTGCLVKPSPRSCVSRDLPLPCAARAVDRYSIQSSRIPSLRRIESTMGAAASSPLGGQFVEVLLLLLRQGESPLIIQQQASHRRSVMAPASSASPQREQVMKLVLVRHGETDLNRSRIIQGRLDTNLNQTGRRQAAMVAGHLSQGAMPAVIYSSDMNRATQTAEAIAEASGSHLVIVQDLTEMHMGEFQGLNRDDVKRSEAYETFRRGGRDQPIPGGGESFNQLSERCVSFLNAIAEKHQGELVVVVSHELVIREICRHANPIGSNGSEIPNASISVVHIFGSDGRWILAKFGDVEHLAGDGFP